MKIGVIFSKIGSIGIILFIAVLLVAMLGALLGTAPPAHAKALAPSISITPSTGPTNTTTTVQVNGSGIVDSNNNPLPNGAVTYEYSSSTDTSCNSPSLLTTSSTTVWSTTTPGSFSDSFTWPSGSTAGTYTVCVAISGSNPGVIPAGSFTVTGSGTGTATVSADQSSYTVGDSITVSGTGFPATTSVTLELQSSDGVTTTNLGTVTTDLNGAFSQDYTVPAHPLNSVVIIASYNGQKATSSSLTVKAKAAAKPKTNPTPAPVPAAPPAPIVIVATPTPAPVPTDTPTTVPTDTPTAVPTLAPTPVPALVTVNHTSSTPFNGSLVAEVAIGMGVLLGLGLLFLVGRFVLRRYASSAPPLDQASLQNQAQQMGPYWNAGVPFAQTMAYPPANGPFAPEPPTMQQQVPFNGPVPPGNSGFAPMGVTQQPSPPNDWFASPN